MARTIDSSTLAQLTAPSMYLVWLIRLDIVSDPVYINSGLYDLTFAGGSGFDANLVVGAPFKGVGNIGSIDPITDDVTGSQSLNLTLPGVSLSLDYLHQFINNADLWQRYGAWVWCATVDGNGALVGKPVRVKSGRMDQLNFAIDPDNQVGTLVVTIESQQAYSGEALFTRYVEQPTIDPTDTSQQYIASLANKVPSIGNTSTNASGAPATGVSGSIGANGSVGS